jgi:curli biogenesis system outer membrane secretion channel CsgG
MLIDEHSSEEIWRELWISLASLLRSYTALHGLGSERQVTVKVDLELITARRGENYLVLRRHGQIVTWKLANGRSGVMDFTEAGQLRSRAGLQEMDMAAEQWARDLMRESQQ